MSKYKFRKMYFVCKNRKVISPNVHMTNAYQFKETADKVCAQWNNPKPLEWEKNKPLEVHTVEAFYLVPEALYNEILKKYDADS